MTTVHVFKNGTNLRLAGLLENDNIITVINAGTFEALHQCVGDKVTEGNPVTTHDFHLFWSFLPEAADALEQAGAFVRRVRARTGLVKRSQTR